MTKELKEIIKEKAILNVTNEVYDMEDGSTFMSPDVTIHRVIPITGASVAGTSIAVTCDGPNVVGPPPSRGRRYSSGRNPDILLICTLIFIFTLLISICIVVLSNVPFINNLFYIQIC